MCDEKKRELHAFEGTRSFIKAQYKLGPYVKVNEIVENMIGALHSICTRAASGKTKMDDLVIELETLFSRPLTSILPSRLHTYIELTLMSKIANEHDRQTMLSVFVSEFTNDTKLYQVDLTTLMQKYAEYHRPVASRARSRFAPFSGPHIELLDLDGKK